VLRLVVERESEWDDEQYQLMAALEDYEASLNELGFPLDEVMSAEADPNNPKGTHLYRAVGPTRDWAADALERAQKDPQYSGDNYSTARRWSIERVER
jgi:hypothetical protein